MAKQKGKRPNEINGEAKSTQPCKRERKKNQRNPKTPLISVPYDQCCDTEVNPARAEQGQLRDGDPVLSTNKKPNTPTKATEGGLGKISEPEVVYPARGHCLISQTPFPLHDR